MYSPQIISNIHANLQAINKRALVLFGGSYLAGEATENSDLDFYYVDTFIGLLRHKRQIRQLTKDFPDIKLNIMLVPWFFYTRGWYYVYGQSLDGKSHASPINKTLIIRNCVKLAYLHYLKAKVKNSAYELDKSARELSLAYLLINQIFPNPLRSKKALIIELSKLNTTEASKLKNILTNEQNFQSNSVSMFECLNVSMTIAKLYFRFNLANYLIYNLFFLRHPNPLFLLSNPDIMVLHKIQTGLNNNADPVKLFKEVNKIVFPVIIINNNSKKFPLEGGRGV